MEENNQLLNKNNKLLEEKVQNYKSHSDKDINTTTKNTKKTYNTVAKQVPQKVTNNIDSANEITNTGCARKSESPDNFKNEVKKAQISKMNEIINLVNDGKEQTESNDEFELVTIIEEKKEKQIIKI